jgi:hypothetical protein
MTILRYSFCTFLLIPNLCNGGRERGTSVYKQTGLTTLPSQTFFTKLSKAAFSGTDQ